MAGLGDVGDIGVEGEGLVVLGPEVLLGGGGVDEGDLW